MTDDTALTPGLQLAKERAIEHLTRHYTSDHIEIEDFESRLDLLLKARSLAEIEAAQQGLPVLDAGGSSPVTVTDDPPRQSQFVAAILGGTVKKGAWQPARRVNAIAIMGGVELDLREARFAPGETVLHAVAVMGGIEVIVPPGLRVQVDGIGIMGGFDGLSREGSTGGTGPVLRVEGLALWGGVEVTERLPGESAREAEKRRKAAAKQLRR